MTGTSQPVTSNQSGPHSNLLDLVKRHLKSPFLKPIAAHNQLAFEKAQDFVTARELPICLDSFCGTGYSTAQLAEKSTDRIYIGIDQSGNRLDKHGPQQSDNYLLVQAEAGDFWRLAVAAGWRIEEHWILYPNPWPKSAHLSRRVHGSPVFAALLALGGQLECRSNWQLYIEELGLVLDHLGMPTDISRLAPAPPLTLFEKKYQASNHPLWRCSANLKQFHNRT